MLDNKISISGTKEKKYHAGNYTSYTNLNLLWQLSHHDLTKLHPLLLFILNK